MQQLVYGSADQIAGRQVGGWGVLHATPDLTAESQKNLLAMTSVALPTKLPQFPSAEQLAMRSVRFRLDPHSRFYAVCRSTEAGTDHTGRPGNVVSHCAVIDATEGLRPVDWFFSTGWVNPYGPRQIAEATLQVELPAPAGWADTASWLRADPARTAQIRWIVDTAFAQLLSTERVVLVSPTAELAARWASVFSWLLESCLANRVRIRIGEDPRTLHSELAVAPVLVSVEQQPDPATLKGLIPIDVTWQLSAEDAAATGMWVLPGGQQVPASGLTGLAVDLAYAETDIAAAVFALRDSFLERFRASGHVLETRHVLNFLQAAWLATPGAQQLARIDPIRQLLQSLDDDVRRWDEMVALATEVGVAVPVKDTIDVYALPVEEVDPWQVDDEPTGVEAALIGAAQLGRAGIDVEAMLATGDLLKHVDEQPEELRQAVRDMAAVLEPHATLGEDI